MFTTPTPSGPTLSTTTSPASPTSPSRPSRLRGLSYLRNYTHTHLHAHSNSPPGRENDRPSITRTRSNPPPDTSAEGDSSGSDSRANSQAVATSGRTSGWLPSVSGRSGLSRVATQPEPRSTSASLPATIPPTDTMTRNRSETAAATIGPRQHSDDGAAAKQQLPSIRFIPHQDPRAPRPSLVFPAITRTLPDDSSVIRVGRYSERDNAPEIPQNQPSAAPVGFKSKVVSRRHCEFWCSNSQWYIRDVKSSSGTFLNHIRLSQPGMESRPYAVNDGDVVQLGIDFRGGEEMIFRCVKIRIECNRGWQKSLNNFNKNTHKRLRNLARGTIPKDAETASTHSSECSICLMSIAPCQSLFVAPCSHVWHYKCIRPILNGSTWPNFLCPNCRAVADLEADVDEPGDYEEWEEEIEETIEITKDTPKEIGDRYLTPRASQANLLEASNSIQNDHHSRIANNELAQGLGGVSLSAAATLTPPLPPPPPSPPPRLSTPPPLSALDLPDSNTGSASASSPPVPIANAHQNLTATPFVEGATIAATPGSAFRLSPEPTPGPDCPMTPRNDAGPFVFDGSAGRPRRSMGDGEQSREGVVAS